MNNFAVLLESKVRMAKIITILYESVWISIKVSYTTKEASKKEQRIVAIMATEIQVLLEICFLNQYIECYY